MAKWRYLVETEQVEARETAVDGWDYEIWQDGQYIGRLEREPVYRGSGWELDLGSTEPYSVLFRKKDEALGYLRLHKARSHYGTTNAYLEFNINENKYTLQTGGNWPPVHDKWTQYDEPPSLFDIITHTHGFLHRGFDPDKNYKVEVWARIVREYDD